MHPDVDKDFFLNYIFRQIVIPPEIRNLRMCLCEVLLMVHLTSPFRRPCRKPDLAMPILEFLDDFITSFLA